MHAGQNVADTGLLGIYGQFNTTPTTITSGNFSPLQLTSAARLIVDGSQVTQPVSGTVTANAGTGQFNVTCTAANCPMNVAQFGGNALVTGTGTGGNGIPRTTVSSDSSAGTATQSSTDRTATGSITSTTCPGTGCVVISTQGGGAVTFEVTGTWTATVQFEVDVEGAGNWNSATVIPVFPNGAGVSSTSCAGTCSGRWTLPTGGVNQFRVRASAYTSGTVTVNLEVGQGQFQVGIVCITASNCNVTDTQGTSPWVSNVTQFGSSSVVTGTGASGAGIPRVTVSNDSSLAANQSVNVSQINAVTPLMGNGTTGTGSPRVTISSDNTVLPGVGAGATGSAVPANAAYHAGNGTGNLTGYLNCDNTAIYDAATNGSTQLVALASSKIVYVCGFQISQSTTTSVHVALEYGTGTACATSPTKITPNYPLQAVASSGPIGMVVMTPGFTGLKTTASQELCILTDAAVSVQALVWYTQF